MKNALITAVCFLISFTIQGQNVAINSDGSNADASAMLEIKSANKGLLIPRISLTGTDDIFTITDPQVSLLIYNLSSSGSGLTAVQPGYYYWNAAKWERLLSNSTAESNTWQLGGNSGINPALNFIG
ncbi:MAG: hypothetical protein ACRC2O_11355, partial [Chitinophagaceae bacterium]